MERNDYVVGVCVLIVFLDADVTRFVGGRHLLAPSETSSR